MGPSRSEGYVEVDGGAVALRGVAGGEHEAQRGDVVPRGVVGLAALDHRGHELPHRAREAVDEPGAAQRQLTSPSAHVELEVVTAEEAAPQAAAGAVDP